MNSAHKMLQILCALLRFATSTGCRMQSLRWTTQVNRTPHGGYPGESGVTARRRTSGMGASRSSMCDVPIIVL